MNVDLSYDFPDLNESNHHPTSPATADYNCIAWAAGEDDRFWWPHPSGAGYWPPEVPRAETQEAFLAAFALFGYAVCEEPAVEEGYEKVALYADQFGKPTHMARQLPDGTWTSKLGQYIDINHYNLAAVDGPTYGTAVVILRRAV